MIQSIISAVAVALVGVLVAIIKDVGDAGVAYFDKKKEKVVQEIGADKYYSELSVAKVVWGIVDEYFRITPTVEKTIASTGEKFKEEILKKLPYLTDDEIEHLRQAVAGEVNKYKEAVEAPVVEVAPADADVKASITQLQTENAQLKQTISTIQDTVKSVQAPADNSGAKVETPASSSTVVMNADGIDIKAEQK